jgi:hypothetical protein
MRFESKPERDGDQWERKVKFWLILRYPAGGFVEVPAEHGGDFGIEGFSRDGIAYQCYAPKSALKVKELYELQRIKINTDIGKFVKRAIDLEKLFGTLKIKAWWLVVPEHRSAKLIQYANGKAAEVRAAKLSYVGPEFCIHIADPTEFASEEKAALRAGIEELRLEEPQIAAAEVQEWADKNDDLVKQLDRKIQNYSGETHAEKIRYLRKQWIERFIAAENILQKLQQKSPSSWEEVDALKKHREKLLFIDYGNHLGGSEVLHTVIDQLKSSIADTVPNLARAHSEEIALGAVSEWLHRCPLDFPE